MPMREMPKKVEIHPLGRKSTIGETIDVKVFEQHPYFSLTLQLV